MKITGTSKRSEKLIDSVKAGTAVGKLDVGENEPRLFLPRQSNGFGMGPRDTDDVMAEALDQRLDIHGDESLVLDDENVGCDLGGEFTARFFNKRAQRRQGRNPGLRPLPLPEKPSSATSKKAWRGRGVIWVKCCSGGKAGLRVPARPLTGTEFQILVKRR